MVRSPSQLVRPVEEQLQAAEEEWFRVYLRHYKLSRAAATWGRESLREQTKSKSMWTSTSPGDWASQMEHAAVSHVQFDVFFH